MNTTNPESSKKGQKVVVAKRGKRIPQQEHHCLHPSTPPVCRLRLLAFATAAAALDLDAALLGGRVGVSVFSGTGDVVAGVAAMPSLLSARREPLTGAVLVRGNLLLAAAEDVRLLDEGAGGMALALRLLLFQLVLVCEPALLSRLTGR